MNKEVFIESILNIRDLYIELLDNDKVSGPEGILRMKAFTNQVSNAVESVIGTEGLKELLEASDRRDYGKKN